MNLKKEFQVKQEPRTNIGKAWHWVWHSNSIWSWFVALLIAFIIVKLIFFPLLSLTLGTKLPLVVVESGSMSHHQASFLGNTFSTKGSFNSWWNEQGAWYPEKNITNEEFSKFPFKTGMEKGDIIIVTGYSKPRVGSIIIFNANTLHPIIHRVIKIETINGEQVYSTKGDNNAAQLDIEKSIPKDAIVGKAVFKIPKLGWIKLFFVELANSFSGN